MKNEEVQNTEDRTSTEIASDIRERRNRMDSTLVYRAFDRKLGP